MPQTTDLSIMPSLLSVRPSLVDVDATFLPMGQMRQIQRVTLLHEGHIEGEMDVGSDHWVYPLHFPDDPIFPGTLMLEAAGQLVALWAWANGRRGRPRLVRISGNFVSPAGPASSCLLLKGVVQRKRQVFFGSIEVTAGGVKLAAVELALVVLPHESL